MARDYNDYPLIKERVTELLKEKKMTQVFLAEQLGIDKDYLNKCLRYRRINKQKIIEIAKILDCSPYYICDESVSYMPYASYERWNYDIDDCLKGFLYANQYNPERFSEGELLELKNRICQLIDDYVSGLPLTHPNTSFDLAYWVNDTEASDKNNK